MKLRNLLALGTICASLCGCGTEVGTAPLPIFANAVNDTFEAISGATLRVAAPQGLAANDTLNGFSLTPGQSVTSQGGVLQFFADGSFNYTPASGFTGVDSVNYQVGSSTATVTFNVNRRGFFVNNTAAAGGNGSQASPFNTLQAALTAADRDNDIIFVFRGDGTSSGLSGGGTITLSRTGLSLVGEGAGLSTPQGSIIDAGGFPVFNEAMLAAADSVSISGIESQANVLQAIGVSNRNNFSLTRSRLLRATDDLVTINNVTGSLQLNNNAFECPTGSGADGIVANLNSGATTLTVSGNSFLTRSTGAGEAFDCNCSSTANVSLTADNNTSSGDAGGLWEDWLELSLENDSRVTLNASNNVLSGINNDGIDVSAGGNSVLGGQAVANNITVTISGPVEFDYSGTASGTFVVRDSVLRGGAGSFFNNLGTNTAALGVRNCRFLTSAEVATNFRVAGSNTGTTNLAITNSTAATLQLDQSGGGTFNVEQLAQLTTLNTLAGVATTGTITDVAAGTLNIP